MLTSPAQALRVLVLDGGHRQALTTVRSLGRRRARVAVADAAPHVAAAASRFCAEGVRCPDPHHDGAAYVRWLRDRLQRHRDEVLVSFDTTTVGLLSAHRDVLGSVAGGALPEPALLHGCAQPEGVSALAAEIGLAVATPTAAGEAPASLQHDYALLALLRRGDPIATFVYRLRAVEAEALLPWFERSASESTHHPSVRRLGLELLTRRRWHGVAAVGLRHDVHRERFALLGVHPSWTDGMELAIACGIDMPWLYAQLAAGRPITGPTFYRSGRKRRRVFSPPRLTPAPLPALEPWTALRLDTGTDRFFQDPLPHLPTVERAAVWLRQRFGRPRRAVPHARGQLHVVAGGRHDSEDNTGS